MRVISLFSGAGGLDLGFKNAGFEIVWANEYDKHIWATFEKNFPKVLLDRRSITDISPVEMPSEIDGIIGGPPCQSWSEFGSKRGIDDPRGKLFEEYVKIIRAKKTKFFLAENVSGILAKRHASALAKILKELRKDYIVLEPQLLNANDFGVPQDRERVIFVGYRRDLGKEFLYPEPLDPGLTLKDAIWDLRDSAVRGITKKAQKRIAKRSKDGKKLKNADGKPIMEVVEFTRLNCANTHLKTPNHEYYEGTYSPHYMSRNRVRKWDEPSFTIQAGARHAPIHPQAPPMRKVAKDQFEFDGPSHLYRRLSVRECARIQTFPDDFEFVYDNIAQGYKMVGNAVPVKFAEVLAKQIRADLECK